MDKIILKDMAFYGYHGLLKEESVLGQKFFIDIEIETSTKEAGINDDFTKTINYAEVYEITREFTEDKRFNLIEALAENIAAEVLNRFDIAHSVMVRIRKKEAPVKGIFDYMGVEIRRYQNEQSLS
ncbi:dihydroneopterin aldolase [Peptacetobacter sp.]|uniref:dihydroneopterin aldolase n=1 Tax=unclassified Peptacetobacter TaxID=2991974 RepID=UPI002613D0AB|nr:dihydroneopterin aldolase [Peptacetobacter sp.]MEE0452289.1 dihydroneopterin aldolase [Peptacetobacter sp.]